MAAEINKANIKAACSNQGRVLLYLYSLIFYKFIGRGSLISNIVNIKGK